MIHVIDNLPENMVGFRAEGEITEQDFTNIVMPRVKESVRKIGKLNYMLVLDTPLRNFTIGAWIKDAAMGLKHLVKWNRAAIVSDEESIRKFTNMFSHVVPGEFRGFRHSELQEATDWASGKTE